MSSMEGAAKASDWFLTLTRMMSTYVDGLQQRSSTSPHMYLPYALVASACKRWRYLPPPTRNAIGLEQ